MKCSVCGKTISEFATVCPFCYNQINAQIDKQTAEKKAEDYKESTAKNKVLAGLIPSCILAFFSIVLVRLFGGGTIGFLFVIPELCCIGYGLYVIFITKIVSFSNNKKLILVSFIAGVLTIILQILKFKRYFGTGIFEIKHLLVQRVLLFVPTGVLVALIIIFAYYLLSLKKKNN